MDRILEVGSNVAKNLDRQANFNAGVDIGENSYEAAKTLIGKILLYIQQNTVSHACLFVENYVFKISLS